jgi:hypothetical protein
LEPELREEWRCILMIARWAGHGDELPPPRLKPLYIAGEGCLLPREQGIGAEILLAQLR